MTQMTQEKITLAQLESFLFKAADILRGRRAVTAETAVHLGRFLGADPEFRMNLQSAYDVWVIGKAKERMIEDEVPPAVSRVRA